MAVTGVAAAEDDTVGAPLKGPEDKHRIDPAGAGHPDDLNVRRVVQTVIAREIRTGVGAPVAAKGDNQRLKLFYLHIASTSAIIWSFLNPRRSIAPDGQVTVQQPQPWQTAGLTEATRRMAVVRSGIRNSFSS